MNSIVVDPTTLTRLQSIDHTVALTDGDGRILGHFVPVIDSEQRQKMEPQISEEELDRRERLGGGRPLVDILRDLQGRQ